MNESLYVGVMSGTSLDGVDAVLLDAAAAPRLLASVHRAFDEPLRRELLALNSPGDNEVDRCARLGNELAKRYAAAVIELLRGCGKDAAQVRAIGCHGQTVRHRPDRGYTLQIGNAALLAELTGVTVVADFRARDIAAGGQGAPLAPAFHATLFRHRSENRVIVNLGGIANVTRLPIEGTVLGYDCGPGNCLLDLWAAKHLGKPYDDNGEWAAGGSVLPALLARLRDEPFLDAPPPKSTGRDLFNEAWLSRRLRGEEPRAVQATLLEFTARCVADACQGAARVIVCGGGTSNGALMRRLAALLAPAPVESSAAHGLDPSLVEAAAFAWLAERTLSSAPGNLAEVTGARGPRVLGAIYPK
ncbi:MAG TPA: anhydro-N-acetylmuramic acid kinase [Burkholderiales bacterium]|nr:anhydro-N-acetylmuramic acid kinase [Burkholderiales bacterium]